jgi:hypothetical protein
MKDYDEMTNKEKIREALIAYKVSAMRAGDAQAEAMATEALALLDPEASGEQIRHVVPDAMTKEQINIAIIRRYLDNAPRKSILDKQERLLAIASLDRLDSRPAPRDEKPDLNEEALRDPAYGPAGYNPNNEWQNCRDLIEHIVWQYKHALAPQFIIQAKDEAIASFDLLHARYATLEPRDDTALREALEKASIDLECLNAAIERGTTHGEVERIDEIIRDIDKARALAREAPKDEINAV